MQGSKMVDKGLQVEEVWQCPFCVKMFESTKYLDMHKATKHSKNVGLSEEKLMEFATKVQQATADQMRTETSQSMQAQIQNIRETSQNKLLLAELTAIKQVKALEEELRDSTTQIQEVKSRIAVLHTQRENRTGRLSRANSKEREKAQIKQERLDQLETKIENLEKLVKSLGQVNIRLTAELEKERLAQAREEVKATARHAKEVQTTCTEEVEEEVASEVEKKLKQLRISPTATGISDAAYTCARTAWDKERATHAGQCGSDATASCSGETSMARSDADFYFAKWKADQEVYACDCSAEDELEPSASSYDSDQSPRTRKLLKTKQKGRLKKKKPDQKGRTKRKPRKQSSDSSSSGSDSDVTPLCERVRWDKRVRYSRSPPDRSRQSLSKTSPRNPVRTTEADERFRRQPSRGISIGRRPQPPADAEHSKFDLGVWDGDEDDLPSSSFRR